MRLEAAKVLNSAEQALVDARDQPLRLSAVLSIFRAKCLIQSSFLHVNSVDQRRGYGHYDRNARNPILLLKSYRKKRQQ
jgi:hypothetical protein